MMVTLIEVFASQKGRSHYHDHGEILRLTPFCIMWTSLEGDKLLYLVKRPAVLHSVFLV